MEVAPDQLWYLKYVEDEGIFVKIDESRFKTKSGLLTENILEVKPCASKNKQLKQIFIYFKVPSAVSGKIKVKFDIENFDSKRSWLVPGLTSSMSMEEFVEYLKPKLSTATRSGNEDTSIDISSSSARSPVSSPVSSTKPAKAKRPKTNEPEDEKNAHDTEDLTSPSKKIRPSTVDEEIDAHYIGRFHLKVDSFSDHCPKTWLDREIDDGHVQDIAHELTEFPTMAKIQQPWLGITDVEKKDLTSKATIKGCRITVIGGRHRQAAYKQVSQVSDSHKCQLEKVWIDLYDCKLSNEQIRRMASLHNTRNKPSMATTFITRVHSCREWLYSLAGKDINVDETPPSHYEWKRACQKMYVQGDKNQNVLEPTLQAALLKREVYTEFRKVSDLFNAGGLKDQKLTKKKLGRGVQKAHEITQNQLGMPLQGLSNETKLSLLKEVNMKLISLKEMRKKSDRIKKKQLVVNAFLRHAGESSWEDLKERFPLHTTEEKLAQFSESAITQKKTPKEVINFFEKAFEWENQKQDGPINLHEERAGVFIYTKNTSYGILMEGTLQNLDSATEKVKRILGTTKFKGFSLVTATFNDNMTSRDLTIFLTNVHAANVDYLQSYSVAIFTKDNCIATVKENLEKRFGIAQMAYWVDTKPQKAQGNTMKDSVHPIVIGYWSKEKMEALCHFDGHDNASNAFCFEREESRDLPKDVLRHIVKHFSLELQWVLDVTNSKDSGLVAALSLNRNCVSLMGMDELRETAKLSAKSVSNEDAVREDILDESDGDYRDKEDEDGDE